MVEVGGGCGGGGGGLLLRNVEHHSVSEAEYSLGRDPPPTTALSAVPAAIRGSRAVGFGSPPQTLVLLQKKCRKWLRALRSYNHTQINGFQLL